MRGWIRRCCAGCIGGSCRSTAVGQAACGLPRLARLGRLAVLAERLLSAAAGYEAACGSLCRSGFPARARYCGFLTVCVWEFRVVWPPHPFQGRGVPVRFTLHKNTKCSPRPRRGRGVGGEGESPPKTRGGRPLTSPPAAAVQIHGHLCGLWCSLWFKKHAGASRLRASLAKKETLRPVTAGGFKDRESDRADQRSG